MTTYAIINGEGVIANRIILDDAAGWELPEGFTLTIETETAYEIGGTLIDGVYAPPTPAAPDPGIIIPAAKQSVTPRQARLALLAAGLLPSVENAVKAAGGATQITWEYATEIDRNSEMITTLGASLGLSSAAIDLLFKQAASL
jgi:hypothetical protein